MKIKKYYGEAMVLENQEIAPNYFLMKLQLDCDHHVLPGQFYMIYSNDHTKLLGRPLSVYDYQSKKRIVSFYYEVVGNGTKDIAQYRIGSLIKLLGPLGNGFKPPLDRNILMIGGGIGIAPFYYYYQEFQAQNRIMSIFGGRDKNALKISEKFNFATMLYSDDGSVGTHGLVTKDLVTTIKNKKIDLVLGCGNMMMLQAVMRICNELEIDCFISAENRFACGVGACDCCSIKGKDKMLRVCKRGPIFNMKDLIIENEK